MKSFKTWIFVILGIVALVTFGVIFPSGCNSFEVSGLHIVRPLEKTPTLEDIRVVSSREIDCIFSNPVEVSILYIQSIDDESYKEDCLYSCDEEGKLTITLPKATEIGKEYKICGVVENSEKSSLTFSFDFMGQNDHRAALVLSEIRDGYSSKKPECEFIELYVLSDGNTAGYEIYSAYDGEAKSYQFPPMEVKKGEYITVHLRDMGEDCVDEIGDNVKLNKNISDTCSTSRDLFAKDSEAHLGADNDVILLQNFESKEVYDAICYAKMSKLEGFDWKKIALKEAASRAVEAGVWTGDSIEDAVNADGLTVTHSLARQNLKSLKDASFPYPNGKEYWILTENRKAITPGKANSSSMKK